MTIPKHKTPKHKTPKHKLVTKAIKQEHLRCLKVALDVMTQFDAMGFRHDAGKAAGARAVFEALGGCVDQRPHTITSVAGISPVFEI